MLAVSQIEQSRRHRNERGITVPMTAAFIFMLLAVAALAIDIGIAYTARASVQHAADAAALAGAFTFVNRQDATDPGQAAQAARDAAAAVANSNYVLGQQLKTSPSPVDPSGGVVPPCNTMRDNSVCVDPGFRRVTVKVMVPLKTYFASIWPSFGLLNVRAVASAEAAPHAVGSHCMKPLFIPNTAMAPTVAGGSGEGPGGTGRNAITSACSRDQTFFDPTTSQPTSFAQSKIGTTFTISPLGSANNGHDGDEEDGTVGPNQYLPIDFGNGVVGYKCGISHCLNDSACANAIDPALFNNFVAGCTGASSLNALPTVPPSVTRAAFDDLQGQTPDRFFGVGDYGVDLNSTADTSNSVLTLPVWNNCDPRYPIAAGAQQYPVSGMVQFFLDPPDARGNITAHLVGFANCDSNGNGTGPGGIPVRLVNIAQQ
jgi:Putative Flp pilus-assembly TadE/G-like